MKIRFNKCINPVIFLGNLGIFLIPINSFPLFPLSTEYRPLWVFPFIALFFFQILKKFTVRRLTVALAVFVFGVIVQSVLLYSIYSYPSTSGLQKGAIVLVLFLLTTGGVVEYLKYIVNLFGIDRLLEVVSRTIGAAAVLPVLIGLVQLTSIFWPALNGLVIKLTSLFSFRYTLGRVQMTTGEPSWAAVYILFTLGFIIPYYKGGYKKTLIFLLIILFIFTGSTLGYMYLLIIGAMYVIIIRPKFLLKGAVLISLATIVATNVKGLLPVYTKNRIELVLGLINNLTYEQVLIYAGSSNSFLLRFLNPLIALKIAAQTHFIGIGMEAFQYRITDEHIKMGIDPERANLLLSAGATPKFLVSKIIVELGAIGFFLFSLAFILILRSLYKRGYRLYAFLMLASLVLVINFDSYLFHVPIFVILIGYVLTDSLNKKRL